jgi:type IV pilus assembly protein PilB
MAQAEELLVKLRREGEEREAQRKASKFGVPYFDVSSTPIQVDALSLISEEEARRLRVGPFQFRVQEAAVAVFDPESPAVKKFVEKLNAEGTKTKIFAASLTSLEHIWAGYKYVAKKAPEITGRVTIEQRRFEELYKKLTDLEKVKKEISGFDFKTFSAGQLLEVVIAGALSNRASDIHLEAEEKDVRLRYRIDGLLHDVVPQFSKEFYPLLVSRIKLLSNLKLNVTDQPQDGRFTINIENKEVEVRVSIIPSEFGETIVMRVLDPAAIKLRLSDLGLRKDDLEIIERELRAPNGMILNTGPTGSGKTTTLYAFLLHKQIPEIKIITIEDPIEYRLEDIEQTQVNPEAGYTFANGLRSIMRQDPDVILVGEIRDAETGGIAIQAALTGHLVFSTVHANSASGAIPRLLDLKVKPASIGPSLNLVIAQRLVRRLCRHCKISEKIGADLKKNIEKFFSVLPKRVDRGEYQEIQLFKPQGCSQCNNLGYKGRVAIFELMEVGDEMEKMITPQVFESALHHQALKQGMVTMQEDGILKVISGMTTFDEVEAVSGPIKFIDLRATPAMRGKGNSFK